MRALPAGQRAAEEAGELPAEGEIETVTGGLPGRVIHALEGGAMLEEARRSAPVMRALATWRVHADDIGGAASRDDPWRE